MSALPPFRARFQSLLGLIYSSDRLPNPVVTDESASWMVDTAEIWGTCGEYNRLTRLVLAAHRLRLYVALIALRGEPGFRVTVTPREIAPYDANQHHPGLGDLADTCYTMGGKESPVSRLERARQIISTYRPFLAESGDELLLNLLSEIDAAVGA
ncbi:MAG: hypothetical protein AAB214_08955 [Fibrobacterota bacterium]